MPKIVFFNHYHRGDLHTNKEFIKILRSSLPSNFQYEYLHNNPAILTEEFKVKKTGTPNHLDHKTKFYEDGDTLYVNTWVGSDWEIFCKHGGINMFTLYDQWKAIYEKIGDYFRTDGIILYQDMRKYLPTIDYSVTKKTNIYNYIKNSPTEGRMLICNNVPNSNQSFAGNMSEYIIPLASENPHVHFICTNKFPNDLKNILYTEDIIGPTEETDLLEISHLSMYCDVIVGKNSGPYVFCETYSNYMNSDKTFISFNTKNPQFDTIKETMSNGLDIRCRYITVPIENNVNLTDDDKLNILNALISI